MKWIKRIVLGVLAALGFVLVLGVTYEQLARRSAARDYPPPGRLIEVGDHQLHLNCTGHGGPVVILEHGLTPYASATWVLVQAQVEKTNRVCSYDRPGYIWSTRGAQPGAGREIVAELRYALADAGETPPYVLVGHSYGGLIIRIFTEQHPGEVGGLVFVDSSHPDQDQRFAEVGDEWSAPSWWESLYTRVFAEIGVIRFWKMAVLDNAPKEALFAHEFTPQNLHGFLDEFAVREQTEEQARNTGPFGAVPTIVLTAAADLTPSEEMVAELPPEEIELWLKLSEVWIELQRELAALSTVSDQRFVENSNHYIPFQAPDSVVKAVRDTVALAKGFGIAERALPDDQESSEID